MVAKTKTAAAKSTKAEAGGKSLEDFRLAHDRNYIVPKKIKEALLKLGNGGWEYEIDFIKLAGVSATEIVAFRDQFEEFIVVVKTNGSSHRKNVWAGTAALARKLREMAS